MHLVVTGANGLVGRRLVAQLAAQGHHVTALARGPMRFVVPAGAHRYVGVDLGDAGAVKKALHELKPDAIINPAGMTDVDGCDRDRDGAYVANVEAVATLCRAARDTGAFLLHVSTDYVFDGHAGPYAEDAVPNPRGTYAITKALGEQTVRALLPEGAWAIARTAVVYGWPNAGKNNFGSWLIDSMKAGKPVKLFEDQWVSPSLALNVAGMLAEIATRKLPGVWHTCGSEVIDRVSFGRRFARVFGFDEALAQPSRMADVKLLAPRPSKSGLRVEKTLAALTVKPLTLDASLALFHAEYLETHP